MAKLQTALTAFLANGEVCHIALGNSQTIAGIIKDDGSAVGDDSIVIAPMNGAHTIVPKAMIANIEDPSTIVSSGGKPGQGTNAIKLI